MRDYLIAVIEGLLATSTVLNEEEARREEMDENYRIYFPPLEKKQIIERYIVSIG